MSEFQVGLFVTCLVDLFRPNVGMACMQLLEKTNCQVFVPEQQTCCGQPAYNNGDFDDTRDIAKQVIDLFESYDYIVVPSGSCAGMLKKHYLELFSNDPFYLKKAKYLAERTHELTSFLVDILKIHIVETSYPKSVTYHDSCSSLRELHIKNQPRKLLEQIQGLTLCELPNAEICCGFGGTFCVKYSDISNKMVADKVNDIKATGAEVVVSADLGCLLNIAGKLKREKSTIEVFHIAEILANSAKKGIGEGESSQ